MIKKGIGCLLAVVLLCGLWMNTCAEEEVCATAEQYLSQLMAIGISVEVGKNVSFDMYVTDALYAELTANDDALLHQLELRAGMAEVHYSSFGTHIHYRNAKFDDLSYAADLAGLMDILNAGPFIVDRTQYVQCSDALYEYLTTAHWSDLHRILNDCCGIVNVNYSTGLLPVIAFTPRTYYPSLLMIQAWRTGDVSALTKDEQAALAVAEQWAAQITPGDTVSVMRQIHDLICEKVAYDTAMTLPDRHSCIGALLYGTCVCDGYADTFALLGTMCGLDVRIQIGTTPSGEELLVEQGNHAWNMVRVGEAWHMVDVTWDDVGPVYDYFNLSRSDAPETHTWVWGPEGWDN